MYRDKDVLTSFAKIASQEFLGPSQVSLNHSLKKIASQENLTPHQIEFVAAESNRLTWAKLFAADKASSYDFPLAKSAEVIADLQIKPEKNQIVEADLDYLSPPKSTKIASFDPLEAMGFQKEAMDKTAAKKSLKRELQSRFEKMALAKEEIELRILENNTTIENATLSFVKEARTLVLETPDDEKAKTMDKIAEFVASCGNHDQGRKLMHKLATVMRRQGIMKEADLKAPDQYISKNTPARIINGNHGLYITVKTIFERQDLASSLHNRYEIVDSSLPIIQEKIREL